MELIILGHVIGDFYVQTDEIAERKKKSIKYMLIHCLVYTIVIGIGAYILYRDVIKTGIVTILIFFSHLVIDLLKRKMDKKAKNCEYIIFLGDQLLHIASLILIFCIIKQPIQFKYDWMVNNLNVNKCIAVAIAILICWKPAAIFVSLIFKIIPETIEQANETNKINEKIEKEGAKIGSWIGILEREIILILGLMGQYGAMGFVLTAKSLARFKQLENKSFAEKYLVGTLLSALISIVCIALYKINC